MKPAIDKTTSKEKFNLVGLDDSFPNKPHGSWGKSVSVQTVNYSCLENPHGQRSLAGYSQWGRKESDMAEVTEHMHTHPLIRPGLIRFVSPKEGYSS